MAEIDQQEHIPQVTFESYLATRDSSDPKNLPMWVMHDSLRDVNEFAYNQIGLSNDNDISILRSLIGIAKQNKNITISYRSLLKAIQAKSPGTSEGAWHDKIQMFLSKLESSGHCLCNRDGGYIKDVVLVKDGVHGQGVRLAEEIKLVQEIQNHYDKMIQESNSLLPYPNQKKFPISEQILPHLREMGFKDFKKGMLQEVNLPTNSLVSIRFSTGNDILIPAQYLDKLFFIALQKIKHYMRPDPNRTIRDKVYNYINQNHEKKGEALLPKEDFNKAIDYYNFQEFDNIEARIWKQALQVLYAGSKNKLEMRDVNQSSSLVLNYISQETEKVAAVKEEEKRKEQLNAAIDEEIPHIIKLALTEGRPFSEKQLGEFQDYKNEQILREKYEKEAFDNLIKRIINERVVESPSPDLLYFEHANKVHFLHKDRVVNFMRTQIEMIKGTFLNNYRLPWSQDVKNYNMNNRPLYNNQEFHDFLEEYVEENYPYFWRSMDHGETFYRIHFNLEGRPKALSKVWFVENKPGQLKSVEMITGLTRKYVFNEALHQLSIFYWWGPYRRFMAWLRGNQGVGPHVRAKKNKEREKASISDTPEYLQLEDLDDAGGKNPNNNRSMFNEEKAEKAGRDYNEDFQRVKDKDARNESQRKMERERQKAIKEKAEKLRDRLIGNDNVEDLIDRHLRIWNPNLNDSIGLDTRRNVDDAIESYIERTIRKKIPLDASSLSKILKKLLEKDNFKKVHQGQGRKIAALQKYTELYVYDKYIKPKYKL